MAIEMHVLNILNERQLECLISERQLELMHRELFVSTVSPFNRVTRIHSDELNPLKLGTGFASMSINELWDGRWSELRWAELEFEQLFTMASLQDVSEAFPPQCSLTVYPF